MIGRLKIIILSRGPSLYSTRSLMIAGRKRGHEVKIVDHMKCDLILEKGSLAVQYYKHKFEKLDAIIPRIGASVTSQGGAVIRHFELMSCYTTLSSAALLLTRNKLSCLQLLAGNGIGIPKTLLPASRSMAYELLNELKGPPYVVKVATGTHGTGVLKAENKHTALHLLDTFNQLKEMVIFQEYIKESSGRDIRIIVVGGKVVAAMERRASGNEFRSNLHLGGKSEVIEPTDEECDIAIQSASLMGLRVAGVDLLRSNRGPLVLEVNASPGLEGIETTTKIDIATEIIKLIERSVV